MQTPTQRKSEGEAMRKGFAGLNDCSVRATIPRRQEKKKATQDGWRVRRCAEIRQLKQKKRKGGRVTFIMQT